MAFSSMFLGNSLALLRRDAGEVSMLFDAAWSVISSKAASDFLI